jgi:uncharacterized protein
VQALLGDTRFLKAVNAERYTDERFGLPTVRDILAELEKPGRDPRPEFATAAFREGVERLQDLEPGMVLEGVVTNVTNFGAFIDVGVHQDGLVHISAMRAGFVKDPRDVVKAGDVVRVKVMEIDLQRQRIGLSMRLDDIPGESRPPKGESSGGTSRGKPRERGPRRGEDDTRPAGNALADALAKAGLRR